jgi:hypothetical protein
VCSLDMKKIRNFSCCHYLLFVLYFLAMAFILSATTLVSTVVYKCYKRLQSLTWPR